jgi:esterase/lipase superfamily enzyme
MNERYINWYTPWLSSEFEMLVFGDKRGLPLILFPTSGAHYYENKDFGLVGHSVLHRQWQGHSLLLERNRSAKLLRQIDSSRR